MKRIFIYVMLSIGLLSPTMTLVAPPAYASTKEELKKGACLGDAACEASTSASTKSSVDNIINTIINVFSWVVGVVAVLMVMFGGFRYITAAGDATKTKTAKDTILFALIGLVIVALSQVIVKFVIDQV